MNRKSYLLRIIALIIGLFIFVYTINVFGGFGPVLVKLGEIRFYYLFIVLNAFAWTLLYTEAWHHLFAGLKHKIRYVSLLKIKLGGEGINFMTPFGFIAGDPIRVLLLKRFIGPEARLRSVVVDRILHSLSAQYFCLIGILLIFTQDVDFPFWLHCLLIAVYVFLCTLLTSLIYCMTTGRGFGVFDSFFRLINLPKRFPKIESALNELKEGLEYYSKRPKHPFLISFLYHFAGRVLLAAEILIVFYCYEGQANFLFAIILASLTSFFSVAFGFIPGALGVLEKLYADFFMLYGYQPEVGISIQLVRRLRSWFVIAVGILVLDFNEIADFFKKFRKPKDLKNQE